MSVAPAFTTPLEAAAGNLETRGDVAALQSRLRKVMQPSITVDGILGPQTTRAIADLQGITTWDSLKVDGIFGPHSADALSEIEGKLGKVSPHFAALEFLCNCSFPWCDMDRQTIIWLERIRTHKNLVFGLPVVSGHRNDHHELVIDGAFGGHVCKPRRWATDSPGCETSAVDIPSALVRITRKELREVIGVTGGIGTNRRTGWAVHIDNGPERDWEGYA